MTPDPRAPAAMPAPDTRGVTLHIERVVIDGVALTGAQARQLRAALEGELARLLRQDGSARLGHAGGAVPGLTAPAIQISAPLRPLDLGREIARSVYASFGKAP
jgi:hypothetical protein